MEPVSSRPGFHQKVVEARNLDLVGQRVLHLPCAANRLRRNVSSDLKQSASLLSATSALPRSAGPRAAKSPSRPPHTGTTERLPLTGDALSLVTWTVSGLQAEILRLSDPERPSDRGRCSQAERDPGLGPLCLRGSDRPGIGRSRSGRPAEDQGRPGNGGAAQRGGWTPAISGGPGGLHG